jgi:hypothetical protein
MNTDLGREVGQSVPQELGEVINTAAQVVGDIHHAEGTGASIRCRRGQGPPTEGVIEAQIGLVEETAAANIDHLQIREY